MENWLVASIVYGSIAWGITFGLTLRIMALAKEREREALEEFRRELQSQHGDGFKD
ncbi:MAG: hypothetical protein ACRDHZ_00225 [Ktedonobacteraceae bacterium]